MIRGIALTLIGLGAAVVAHAEDSRLDEVIKRGTLRVCTPGDYKPFSLAKTDGTFEGIDVDLAQAMAKSLGVEARFVKTSWPKLMDDFVDKCDLGVGGISVTMAVVSSPGVPADDKSPKVWSFDKDEVGKPPGGFEFAVAAKKQPGKWIVVKDGDNRVLAQVDRDRTPRRFAMALVKNASYKDVRISVKAKPVAGEEEMVAGLVWRYKDADNYYVARWNTDSVRVDRVVKGERELMTPREIKITLAAKTWHTLTVEHRGDDIKVFVGKERVFGGRDKTYGEAGRIGVWIKADSLTYFDDLAVEEFK